MNQPHDEASRAEPDDGQPQPQQDVVDQPHSQNLAALRILLPAPAGRQEDALPGIEDGKGSQHQR